MCATSSGSTPEANPEGLAVGAKALEAAKLSEAIVSSKLPVYDTRRQRHAMQRFCAGADIGGEPQLLVTLTTPEGWEGDLHHAWRKLIWRLRRLGIRREYYAVREWNRKGTCEHLHVVFHATFIEAELMRAAWRKALGRRESDTCWTKHERVRSVGHMAGYMAKYLAKGMLGGGRGRLYWYAATWVFRSWVTWTWCVFRLTGEYPSKAVLEHMRGSQVLSIKLWYALLSAWLDLMATGFYVGRCKRLWRAWATFAERALGVREYPIECGLR